MCTLVKVVVLEKKSESHRATVSPDTIKQLRKKLRWTQKICAQKLGIQFHKLSEAERGITVPCEEIVKWVETHTGHQNLQD